MPSQEEYLDNLLKGVADGHPIQVEDAATMTEEDIEQLLQKEASIEETPVKEELPQDNSDLISLLESADDSDLVSLLDQLSGDLEDTKTVNTQEGQEESAFNGMEADQQEFTSDSAVEAAAEEKLPGEPRKSRAEKAAERKQKREAKKEARAAAKAQRKAAKESKKEVKEVTPDPVPVEEEDFYQDVEKLLAEDGITQGVDLLQAGDLSQETVSPVIDEAEASADTLAQLMEEQEPTPVKKSLFTKILDLFTEEEAGEEENEDIRLSEENEQILKEMDQEKKKGKKRKGKNGTKSSDAEENNSEAEAGEEKSSKKGKKPTKEKKPRKEKAPKLTEPAKSEKKLSFKKVLPILLICLSVGAAILLLSNVIGEYSIRKAGAAAYYQEDYQTCYQSFFGRDLNESEQVMYSKSESILTIRMWLREYEVLAEEGSELEALDSLLQSVHDYPTLYAYACQWNAGEEVALTYQKLLAILADKYQLSEEDAKQIAETPDDVEYTRKVMLVLQELGYGSWNLQEPSSGETELPDKLPEEK